MVIYQEKLGKSTEIQNKVIEVHSWIEYQCTKLNGFSIS